MMVIRKKKAFYDIGKDGVTQSLLAMFLACREKARLYLKGWNSRYTSDAFTYGSLGHGMLEYAYTDLMSGKLKDPPTEQQSREYSKRTQVEWLKENPKSDVRTLLQLEISLALLEKTLPRYFDFWGKDFKKMNWKGLEEQFEAKAEVDHLVSIKVRGKKDGRFVRGPEPWIFETKTKSMVNEGDLIDTLSLDLQVRIYLWAERLKLHKIPAGVLYNIIRKTSLKMKVNEPIPKFAKRVAQDMDDRPEFYFIRLEVANTKADMDAFEKDFTGLLQDFYNWHCGDIPHYRNPTNCIGKYGRCEYIGACARGDYSNLVKRNVVFKELSDY